jgi:hypothetical protein
MATILGLAGNIFGEAEAFESYVVYRVVDTTLNVANYEPIYAAKGVIATEQAAAPRALYAYIPGNGQQNWPNNVDPTLETTGKSGVDLIPDVVSNVPEPSYALVVALVACAPAVKFAGARRTA